MVLDNLKGDDVILCQITSKDINDEYAIQLLSSDFTEDSLNQESNIRPNRLFTADQEIILYRSGNIKVEKHNEVIESLISIIKT